MARLAPKSLKLDRSEQQKLDKILARRNTKMFQFFSNPEHGIVFDYTPKHRSWLNQMEI